jgi:hypothetical protein
MLLPWLAALLIEWLVLNRAFADELRSSSAATAGGGERPRLPPVRARCGRGDAEPR